MHIKLLDVCIVYSIDDDDDNDDENKSIYYRHVRMLSTHKLQHVFQI